MEISCLLITYPVSIRILLEIFRIKNNIKADSKMDHREYGVKSDACSMPDSSSPKRPEQYLIFGPSYKSQIQLAGYQEAPGSSEHH